MLLVTPVLLLTSQNIFIIASRGCSSVDVLGICLADAEAKERLKQQLSLLLQSSSLLENPLHPPPAVRMSVGLFALPDVSWQGEAACLSSLRTSDSHGGGLSQLPLLRSLEVSPSSLHVRDAATIPPIERRREEWSRREDEAADVSHLKSVDAYNIQYLYSIIPIIPQQHACRISEFRSNSPCWNL